MKWGKATATTVMSMADMRSPMAAVTNIRYRRMINRSIQYERLTISSVCNAREIVEKSREEYPQRDGENQN